MIRVPPIKYGKIKDCLFNLLRSAAERLFLTFLVLVFISLLISSAVFYKYYVLPQKIEPELSQEVIKFQEDIYKKILQEWQDRGERFDAAKTKEYTDPFKP